MLPTQLTVLGLAVLAASHPGGGKGGGEHDYEFVNERSPRVNTRRALEGCASQLVARGVHARAMERRKTTFDEYRVAKGIPMNAPYMTTGGDMVMRDTSEVLATDHYVDIDPSRAIVDESYVFNDTTCAVLNPGGDDVNTFYISGMPVRQDLVGDADTASGTPVVADIQFIDVNSCEPLAGVWADVWMANATGVYSGVRAYGNGDGTGDGNVNSTTLRGVQQADSDGVVQFDFTFPGHHPGRTNNVHIMVHENATLLPDGTITRGNVSHTGQLFFDQDVIDELEGWSPYTLNTAPRTPNCEDSIIVEETAGTDSDPVFSYTYFESDVTWGLFAWILVGIDPSASYDDPMSFSDPVPGGGGDDGSSLPSNPGNMFPLKGSAFSF